VRVDAKPTRARRGPNGGGEDPALCLLPAPISGPGSSCGVDGQGSPGSTGAPLEGLWPPQPGRDLSVVNGPKAFVGVDKRLPPGDGGQRQARAEEDNGNHEEEPRSDRCGALQSVSCRAANPQDPSPAPQDRTASENEERQADRLRSARRELRILRLPPYRPLLSGKNLHRTAVSHKPTPKEWGRYG